MYLSSFENPPTGQVLWPLTQAHDAWTAKFWIWGGVGNYWLPPTKAKFPEK